MPWHRQSCPKLLGKWTLPKEESAKLFPFQFHSPPLRYYLMLNRDSVRSILGNQVVFIMLNLSLESAQKRLESRHGDVEGASGLTTKMHKIYQPAEDNEPNTHNIDIDDKMSKADVVAKVMSVVKDTCEAK